ncbi:TRIGALACTOSYLDIACYLGLYCEROL 4 protein [Nymphaea thermarum]|nr:TRIGALACTOSYLDIACYLGLYCEROL 4 protein [Nymphaea thermarum]
MQFPLHNLLLEMTWPKLFVDKAGTYWEVPMSMAVDIASVPSDSGLSYHLCVDHASGLPKQLGGDEVCSMPPGFPFLSCIKAACSFKRNVDIWRKKDGKLKMVQPYDIFLCEPHIEASARIGGILKGYLGGSSTMARLKEMLKSKDLGFLAKRRNSLLSVDAFASLSCTAQYGNFQRLFLDLTRLSACAEISSGASLVSGVAHLLDNFYKKKQIDMEAIGVVFPDIVFSFQQQIVGPFSLRVDSTVTLDPRNGSCVPRVSDSVYALEYALQVLGSAKAVAWYSTKQREAMIELRFFEH